MNYEYELYQQEKTQKQEYLLTEIADKAYDLVAFAQFLNAKKGK